MHRNKAMYYLLRVYYVLIISLIQNIVSMWDVDRL